VKSISSYDNSPSNPIASEQKSERIFVDSRQLSVIIGMPPYTIRQKVQEGVFPAYRVNKKKFLFKVNEILEIIEGSKIELKSDSNVVMMQKQRSNDLPGGKGGQ